jgi:hypothetical protein
LWVPHLFHLFFQLPYWLLISAFRCCKQNGGQNNINCIRIFHGSVSNHNRFKFIELSWLLKLCVLAGLQTDTFRMNSRQIPFLYIGIEFNWLSHVGKCMNHSNYSVYSTELQTWNKLFTRNQTLRKCCRRECSRV